MIQGDRPSGWEPPWAEHLIGAELLFAVLAKLLLASPPTAMLEALVKEGLLEDIPFGIDSEKGRQGADLLVEWSRQKKAQLDAGDGAFETEAQEYASLFEGPGRVGAAPWESVHLSATGLTFQEETLAVRHWYRRFGLESLKIHNEPDDHIGLELSFLAHLINRTGAAIGEDDWAAVEHYVDAQRQFLAEHLGRWIGRWARQVEAHARTNCWRGVALLLHSAVTSWQELLNGDLEEITTG